MSIFPFVSIPNANENNSTELPIYYEIAWDFDKDIPILVNDDFKIVERNEAIKIWIYKAIRTMRYKYSIYSWNYGCEIEELIGQKYTKGLTESEAKRFIKETLLINPYILDVNVVDAEFDNDILSANISIKTIYGNEDINV